MKAKRFWLRLLCQAVSLGLFFWLAWATRYPLRLKGWGSLYFHLDPFLGLGASLAALRPVLQFWPALLLLALTFIWGRFFCWYLCPMGAAMDLSYWLLGRRFWPLKLRVAGRPAVQTGFLLVFLLLALFGFSGVGQRFDPLAISLGAMLSRPGLLVGLLILIISLVFPRFWCFTICPLGGLLEWTRRLGRRLRRRDPAFAGGLTRRQFLGIMTAGVAAA
ncbi:MAG TPA: 4Fe-4S binding protein, partial [bacterium]|nr:4Fe-4S binding protein [bacterium]